MTMKIGGVKVYTDENNHVKPVEADPVHVPSHYTDGLPCEAIDIIEAVIGDIHIAQEGPQVVFCVGNALKYILRAGRKGDTFEDLRKAENYLHRANTGRWSEK